MAQERMRSVDASRFAMVPRNDIPRSAFDVQSIHKTTFVSAGLVPIYVDEVLPGDSLRLNMTAFARLATPIVPVMDNLHFESFFFYVPSRLLWSNFERFMGEQLNPADSTQFLIPQVTFTNANARMLPGGIADYFGVTASGSVNSVTVNALPFRAYNLIWNDWFRDQDFDTPMVVTLGDGPDTETDYVVNWRKKRPDYFTTARPWPQKPLAMAQSLGVSDPFLPGQNFTMRNMGGFGAGAPISGLAVISTATTSAGPITVDEPGTRTQTYSPYYDGGNLRIRAGGTNLEPDVKVLVNDIRTAVMVQGMLERNARGGSRYTELIRSHFGVVSPDSRLQRPELLGGGHTMMNIQAVEQTSATGLTGGTTVKGDLSGKGTAVVTRHGFSSSFTEHGYIIGLVNVRADLTYQQGVNRLWFKRTQFDFYWPGLAHLGEQTILSREIFNDGSAGDVQVFGYQERWSEYKYKPSRTSGYFRSTVTTPLDMWHFGEEFSVRPLLNDVFLNQVPQPVDRVLVVPGYFSQQVLLDALFDARWVRAMPMFSIPGLGKNL